MAWKSILKPEASTMVGIATVVAVFGVYQVTIGSISQAQASDSNLPLLGSTKKKAGYTALIMVAALVLITKDANVGILGGGTIIAMELSYRHGIMANPDTGRIQNPNPASAYEPAENVIPFHHQGETG